MENNIKENGLVLDFFGIPGCGKSTVSHLLAEELRKKGTIISEPSYDTDHNLSPVSRKSIKLVGFIKEFILHPIKTTILIWNIHQIKNPLVSSIALAMVIIIRTSEIKKNRGGITILDQGLAQLAISICQNSKDLTKLKQAYELTLKQLETEIDVRKIFISVSADTAQKRAEQRGTLNSRMDREKNTKRKKEILSFYELACNILYNNKGIKVDGEVGTEIVVEKIMEVL